MKRVIFFVSVISLHTVAGPSGFSWLLQTSPQNSGEFAHDTRALKILSQIVPKFKIKKNAAPDLAGIIRLDLRLPDDKRVVDGRYIIFTGARPHDASTHALLWIDTKTGAGAFAINECVGDFSEKQCITVGSKSFEADNLPDQFIAELKNWRKKELTYLVLQYVNPKSQFSKFELSN